MGTIIRNAMLFDGTGSALYSADVRVEGERIVTIAAGECSSQISGDLDIDGTGCVLMPGMVEAHGHLSWASSVEKVYHEFMLPPAEMRVAAFRNARILLDYGFTSVYSAGALDVGLEPELKRAIDANETVGPRLVASTIERSPEGDDAGDIYNGRGPEAMRGFIQHCARLGVQSVKLVLSGENAIKPGSAHDIYYSDEELAAAHDEAEKHGLWLAAHVYSPKAIKLALENGVRVIYHCSWADEQALDLMESKKDQIFFAPAIGVIMSTIETIPPPHIDMTEMKANAAEVRDLAKVLIPELRRRGVRVLPGGDYGFPFNPNGRNARDLEHFVNLFGYTPAEALVTATKLGGEIMGQGHELGLIREGYLADLLLVEGDPTMDVTVLQDKARLKMIMLGGRLHKAPRSDRMAA